MIIKNLISEYERRFDIYNALAKDVRAQYTDLDVLLHSLEVVQNHTTIDNNLHASIQKELMGVRSSLGEVSVSLEAFLDKMRVSEDEKRPNSKRLRMRFKKLIEGFSFAAEGQYKMQRALALTKEACNNISLQMAFILTSETHGVLENSSTFLFLSLQQKATLILDFIRSSESESSNGPVMDALNVNTTLLRIVKRISVGKQKAEETRNMGVGVGVVDLELRLMSENEVPLGSYLVTEYDSDEKSGQTVHCVLQNDNIPPLSLLVEHCLIQTRETSPETYERDLKEVLYQSAFLSESCHDDIAYIHLLPKCIGVVLRCGPGSIPKRLDMLFSVSSALLPETCHTLRYALADPDTAATRHPIEKRYCVAFSIANALIQLHSGGLMHKNVRPESVYVLDEPSAGVEVTYPYLSRHIYLFGFGRATPEDVKDRESYAHYPRRKLLYVPPWQYTGKGLRPTNYTMFDDVYALGVVLLEFGLWRSLLKRQDETFVVDEEIIRPDEGHREFREKFVKLAREDLPSKLGRKYAETVEECLNCYYLCVLERKCTLKELEERVLKSLRELAEVDPSFKRF